MNLIIIGAGSVGVRLAQRLSFDKHNITIIEKAPAKVKYAQEHLDAMVIEGNATSIDILKAADIQHTDVFAAMTTNDEVNLITCKIAKMFGVPTTIARVKNPDYAADSFIIPKDELGADYIIHPEKETADAIIRLIKQSNATDIVEFDEGKIQFLGIRLDSDCPVLRTPLKDLGKTHGNPPLRIVALKRKQFTIVPRGEDRLFEGDQIFIICAPDFMSQALAYFGKTKAIIEDIMIIGGGQVGRFIAKALQSEMKIKIIEKNRKKAEKLAEDLKKTLVINGDGSDLDLLTFENLSDMDEFIAVTGDDETNIITSLIARHLKIPRTVTLIKKNEYMPLTPTIGMDAVVSKQMITVNAIQKFIRSRQVTQYAELPGMDAEIIEFEAKDKATICKKPLMELKFPQNSLIAAVLKQGKFLEIPTGLTQVQPGDRVVVFALPGAVKNVEKMF
jgi:trk system potassium uptake protein TrkA